MTLGLLAFAIVIASGSLHQPSVGEGLALEWSAPPACPQAASVRAAIDENLARGGFGPELNAVVVRGAITAEAEGFRLAVSIALPSGTVAREVVSEECAELGDAAGLVIAVVLDPLRVARTVEPAPVPALAPPPTPPPRRRLHADLRAGGVLELGSLAVVRGGATLEAGLVGPFFRVELSLQYLAPRRVRPFDAQPGVGVSVQQASAGVRGCVVPTLGPVELPTCAGVEAGAVWARGIALGEIGRTTLPTVSATLGEELSWISRRRVGLWIRADAMLHLVRPRFRIADLDVAAETGWIGLRVLAGPALRL